jgi:hypothetical protein
MANLDNNSDIKSGFGSVVYPGIKKIIKVSYSRSHGITPDIAIIEMTPQTLDPRDDDFEEIAADGWLLFQWDTVTETTNSLGTHEIEKTVQVYLQGCRPDKANVKTTNSGEIWSIPIFDRRWRWEFGSFSGHWNVKKNGVLEIRKKRTPRELADLCLEAMGEIKYDTTALLELENLKSLPYQNEIFPEVHWDRIPPAKALNELVTALGYRVCLGWDDRVRVEKYGTGAKLPKGDLSTGGFATDLPEIPDSFTVVGEMTRHDVAWYLEAVGLDIDGEWKPIDHLSYRPRRSDGTAGEWGWSLSSPPTFPGISQYYDEMNLNKPLKDPEVARRNEQLKLARETVFKCYRLKYPVGTSEDAALRKKYDKLGQELADRLNKGDRRGDSKSIDKQFFEYEEAGRELFKKAKAVLPGPTMLNPKTKKREPVVLEEVAQVLPCFTERAELAINPQTGDLERKPVFVGGQYWLAAGERNTNPRTLVKHDSYTIIPQHGIIKFNEPKYIYSPQVYTATGSNKKQTVRLSLPALLVAFVAVPLKTVTGEPARFEYFWETPKEFLAKPAKPPRGLNGQPPRVPEGTATKVIRNNQIELAYHASYEWRTNNATKKEDLFFDKVEDNYKTQKLENQALQTLDVETKRMRAEDSGSGVYAGLIPLQIDGAIQQVAFSIDSRGGTITTISRNSEVNILVPDFDERQRDADLKDILKSNAAKVDKTEKVKP